MPGKSAIEWCDDSWNPTVGCTKVDRDCEHCYAILQAARLWENFKQADYEGITKRLPDGSVNWTGLVRMLPGRLLIPARWTKPRKIFTDSMSDLFHAILPYDYQRAVLDVMCGPGSHHVYQVLSKRPDLMAERVDRYLAERGMDVLPEHIWVGTSAGFQKVADERIPQLLQVRAMTRMLSLEPLIGPITVRPWLGSVHWVITGGESGPEHRPFDPQWARDLRDECVAAGVAYFFKQHGGRVAKAGGRLLDARTWDEFPTMRGRPTPFPYAKKPRAA